MRGQKALKNTIAALLLEIVSAICSFILPRLILTSYGSAYNGITTSVGQFISAIALLRGGINGATRAALYKPLAENDSNQISRIVKANKNFMEKVVLIFIGIFLIFATIYPVFVKEEFSWPFSFTLILILGISTIAQNYFGFTYQTLLQADQKFYVNSVILIVTTILNTILSVILINMNCSIHIVKLGSAAVFMLQPLLFTLYVKKHYKIDMKVKADNNSISQRWDAFAHNVADFIHINTDVIILTIFTTIKLVSVYSVFVMVLSAIRKFIHSFTTGIDAMFGNMMAKNEEKTLLKSVNSFECFVFSVSTLLLSCTAVLIQPFVLIYTSGITDISYYRPVFAYMIVISELVYIWRLPYKSVIESAGHFKQTKKIAIVESIINIVVSIICVIKFGLIGVTIGKIFASIYRTLCYAMYTNKIIKERKNIMFVKRLLISVINFVLVIVVAYIIPNGNLDSYIKWGIYSIFVTLISIVITLGINLLFYRQEIEYFVKRIHGILKQRRVRNEG